MRSAAFAFIIIVFVLFSFAPSLYELLRSRDVPQNLQFELTHNDPAEYNFYLSKIRKGIEGRWTARSGSLIDSMYVWMGIAGRWNRVPEGRAADVYHVARLVLVAALIIMIADFFRSTLRIKWPWDLIGFLLVVTVPWRLKFGLTNSAPHILASEVLTVFLLSALISKVTMRRVGNWFSLGRYKKFFLFVSLIVIALGFATMFSWLGRERDGIDIKIQSGRYPLKDFILAMKILEERLPRNAIVLSETTAASYIPVYSGNTVYVGEGAHEFFAGQMSVSQAQAFIRDNNVSAIFFGPQEKEDGEVGDLRKPYPFLESLYTNALVTIYRVP